MSSMNEPLHHLLQRCLRSNDSRAWQNLFERLRPTLLQTIRRTAFNYRHLPTQDYEDILQDTFLKITTKTKIREVALETEASTEFYFRTIAANTTRDFLQNRSAIKRGASQTISLHANIEEITGKLHL